jgi:hypothetical protein
MTVFNQVSLLKSLLAATVLACATLGASAQTTAAGPDADAQKDMARHRAIAAAHEAAAKCLESGKKEEVCHKELQTACKGLAIGKYCGMKHEH